MFRLFIFIFLLFVFSCTHASSIPSVKAHKAKVDVKQLSLAIEKYKAATGEYPAQGQGLKALIKHQFPDPSCPIQQTTLIRSLPVDPWGNEYQYRFPGEYNTAGFDVWSYGADGKSGGAALNADCGNWDSEECKKLYSSSSLKFHEIFYLMVFGLVFGLPPYLYKLIVNWRATGNLVASMKGFHLGVLIYFIVVGVVLLIPVTSI